MMRSTLAYGFFLVLMSLSLLFVADIHAKEEKASKKGTVTKESARKKTSTTKAAETKKAGADTRTAGTAKAAESAGATTGEARAQVTEIRYWSNPDYTRVAITLDREVLFESNQIKQHVSDANPSRIYIDLNASRLGPGVKDLSIGDGLLKTARVGQYRADVVRVVLDVENVKDYKVFPLSDPFRIIIDVKGVRPLEISRLTEQIQPAPAVAAEPKKIEQREEKPRVGARFKPGKIRRIVVDPGHGGHDPGAVGAYGTQEKNVVLAIGLKLAEKLRDELGIDVVMTRSTDVFIPLEERTAIANKVNADLFVSIHANASLNRGASGIETYYLNLAKTEKAAQLAARENGTSLEKVSLLQAILFDLMANYKLNDSAHLAEEVQKSLYRKLHGQYPSTRNLGVKQGPFYVLVGATMPSILVETAFISNEAEEERLKDSSYQEQAAEGILEGIKGYISSLK
ncbi:MULTISPECIES: N-acetylmuramoyl-L-alanine amidase [Geobacter]|uniref:N-acetylmuramoyl-L-alanine amidase n=1 Tax=Geobacter TaxID=28231 RepID=UPI0025736A15|nr:N-acetylmuramoyl-L-alanine amidase [Geobacter sulfurreducens]BET58231.1 N-acetylmuramoyl-L-alanine amidase [Geobacter sp. 60473]